MSLKRQVFSGVRWTTFSSVGTVLLQLIQIAVLARLLKPEDFGLMAIVMAVMVFVEMFSDAGVSIALIHFQNITQRQLSSLYWLNVVLSIVLAVLIVVFSGLTAQWYDHSDIQYLLMLASIPLVLTALGQQIRIRAQKGFRFAALAKLGLTVAFVSLIVTVYLAWLGLGVYSIVGGSITSAFVGCVLTWWFLSDGWRPDLSFNFPDIKKFLKFGIYMILNNIVVTINAQIDVLLGARLLGVEALGLYSVPKNLSMRVISVVNPIVTKVGLPVMAKVQSDTPELKRIYLKTMRMTSSVNFPVYILMAILAPEIIYLLLGNGWETSIQILQVLAIYGLLRSTGNPAGSLILAKGRADLAFKWNLALLCFIPMVIFIGSGYGVVGMSFAMAILMLFLFVPAWYFLIRPLCGASLGEYAMQCIIPLANALVAGAGAWMLLSWFESDWARMIFGFLSYISIYILISLVWNREWLYSMYELLNLLKKS